MTEDDQPVEGDDDADDADVAEDEGDDDVEDTAVDASDDEVEAVEVSDDEDDEVEASDDGSDGEHDGDEDAATKIPERPGRSGRSGGAGRSARVPDRPRSGAGRGGRGRGRRRRLTSMHAVVALTLVIWAGWISKMVAQKGPPSGWDWIVFGMAATAFVGSVYSLLDQQGRLTKYRGRGLGALGLCLGLALASIVTVVVTGATPELGLDLQGGFSVVLSPKGDPPSENIDKAMEVIRQRIDGLGVAEPEVTRQGDNVVVELPGVEDREKAQQLVGRTAKLEFRPVIAAGLPFDEKAAARGEDPCKAAGGDAPSSSAPASSSPTEPGATPTPAPGGSSSTAPGTTAPPTSAPATEGDSGGDSEGVGLIPPAVLDGENAAALPRRQQDPTSTTTPPATAPPTTGAPGDATTTTTAPSGQEPGAGEEEGTGQVAFPTREAEGEERTCVVMGPVGFGGDSLTKAKAELGGSTGSEWVVSVDIRKSRKDDANKLFNACYQGDATCPSKQLAIVLDGVVQSAPTVNDMNLADQEFQISGGGTGFPQSEAKDLALVLRYGALPVEFTPSAERRVSPTLGEDSLRAGILAGLIGLAAVAIYLLFYYRALGVVVIMGLGVWSSLMYGVVCWLSASRGLTLSLAGVVGIVVSLGTTVDSYIVHFERLKDEVRLGKSVRASTERGFQRAFRTILTADLASLLGASLLWWLTVGAVRGFAFFLGLSVVLDIFVAYCFDRPMVALLARSEFFTEHRVWGVARGLGQSGDPAPRDRSVARA